MSLSVMQATQRRRSFLLVMGDIQLEVEIDIDEEAG